MSLILKMQDLLDKSRQLDFLAPLLLRIFLAPIFILAGYGKITHLEDIAGWFEHSLGMPAPYLMAVLAGYTEFLGGIAILFGLAARWFALPLMMTMIVAASTAHWDNGWHALPETKLTVPWEWREDKLNEAVKQREQAREILKQHGDYETITQAGQVTILKNGIEFAATYFLMLLVIFFMGAGRYISIDYWIKQRFNPQF